MNRAIFVCAISPNAPTGLTPCPIAKSGGLQLAMRVQAAVLSVRLPA
jgi:hypothetical protein